MTRMMPPLEVAPVETLEALQAAHLFLCRKCAHSMLPLHSLQYGLNLPCSQVLRGRQSRRLKRSVGSALVTVSLTCDGVAVVRFPTTGIARSGDRCFYTSDPVLVKSAGGLPPAPRPLICSKTSHHFAAAAELVTIYFLYSNSSIVVKNHFRF